MAITENILPDAEDFARMESELFGRVERSHTRQVRRHRLIAGVSVMLLAGAGVASVTEANSVVVSAAAYCYAAASADSHSMQVEAPYTNLSGAKSREAAATASLAHCVDAWQVGLVDPSKPAPTTIPTLQACVRNDQVIAVFPKDSGDSADEFCTSLGMSAP